MKSNLKIVIGTLAFAMLATSACAKKGGSNVASTPGATTDTTVTESGTPVTLGKGSWLGWLTIKDGAKFTEYMKDSGLCFVGRSNNVGNCRYDYAALRVALTGESGVSEYSIRTYAKTQWTNQNRLLGSVIRKPVPAVGSANGFNIAETITAVVRDTYQRPPTVRWDQNVGAQTYQDCYYEEVPVASNDGWSIGGSFFGDGLSIGFQTGQQSSYRYERQRRCVTRVAYSEASYTPQVVNDASAPAILDMSGTQTQEARVGGGEIKIVNEFANAERTLVNATVYYQGVVIATGQLEGRFR